MPFRGEAVQKCGFRGLFRGEFGNLLTSLLNQFLRSAERFKNINPFRTAFRKTFRTSVLFLDVQFVVAITHVHCLAYKKFFCKDTQFCLLVQEGEHRALRHRNRMFLVDAVDHPEPLREATKTSKSLAYAKLFMLYEMSRIKACSSSHQGAPAPRQFFREVLLNPEIR